MLEWLEGLLRPRRVIARLRRRNAYYERAIKDLRATLLQANQEAKELRRFITEAINREAQDSMLAAYMGELHSRVAALNYEVFKLRKDNQTLEIKLSGTLAALNGRDQNNPPSGSQTGT